MAKRKNISNAEWPIMTALWERETATAAEIVAAVAAESPMTKQTIKALINRLVAKGVVAFTKDEADQRVYHYRAALSREEVALDKAADILDMFGAGAVDLVAGFVKRAKLSRDDIASLRNLLDEKMDT